MTKRRSTPGQPVFQELLPDSFWVVTRGHSVIPDGRRFLVVAAWGDGIHWRAWENGIKPKYLGMGVLLREEHFQREADDNDD